MSKRTGRIDIKKAVADKGHHLLQELLQAAAGDFMQESAPVADDEILNRLTIGLTDLLDQVHDHIVAQEEALEARDAELRELRAAQDRQTTSPDPTGSPPFASEESPVGGPDASSGEDSFLISPEWLPTTLSAIEAGTPVRAKINGTQKPGLALPIRYGSELLGVLGFQGENFNLGPDDLAMIEGIAEQVGLALENQRLIDQTQEALAETETLYHASEGLNRSQTLEDILRVIGASLEDRGQASMAYFDLRFDEAGRPVAWAVSAAWGQRHGQTPPAAGDPAPLDHPLLLETVLAQPPQVILIQNIAGDHRLRSDPDLRDLLAGRGAQAAAFLPLTIGPRLIGLLLVDWAEPRPFHHRDVRFFNSLAAQAATAVDSLKLLRGAQERAVELATLSRIQGQLSMAVNEQQILEAVSQAFSGAALALLYFLTNARGDVVGIQTAGTFPAEENNPAALRWEDLLPFATIEDSLVWPTEARPVTHISNLAEGEALSDPVGLCLRENGVQAVCLIPLRSGGRRQALLSLSWPDAHDVSTLEQAMLRSLLEPLGAIVASRRAQLAQFAAQEQTEKLYNASRRINEAGGQLSEIVAIIGELGRDNGINRALLFETEYNRRDELRAIEITANWYSGYGPRPIPVGTRYSRGQFTTIGHVLNIEATFFDDVPTDERVDETMRETLVNEEIGSLAVLPLHSGSQQIGTILLQGHEPHLFSEEEMRMYLSLAPQIAVAVLNRRLLIDAQSRARREQVLRELTEKVRNAPTVDLVMKTAAAEVGRIFGRKTLIYVNQLAETGSSRPAEAADPAADEPEGNGT